MLNGLPRAPTRVNSAQMPSIQRLRRGLPGYLIRFAPHAVAPQRQHVPRWLVAPSVFLPISTHFTTTPAVPPPSAWLEPGSLAWPRTVEPSVFTHHLPGRLRALYAQSVRT